MNTTTRSNETITPGDSTDEVNYYFLALSILPIWSIAMNGLILYCFYKTSGLRQNLSNFIIASMAVDDLLLSLIVVPFAIYLKCWPLDPWTQLIWFCIDVLLSAGSITNLLAITIYRYLAIAYPYRFCYVATKELIRKILISAWSLAFLMSASVFIETIITSHETLSRSTVECYYMQGSRAFLIYGSLFSFFIPLVIMIWAALRSIHLLKKRNEISEALHNSSKYNKITKQESHEDSSGRNGSVNSPKTSPQHKDQMQTGQGQLPTLFSTKERRAIRTLIVVLVIFVIAWFPFFTLQLVTSMTSKDNPIFDVLQNLMFDLAWPGYLTSCINPIVYAVFSLEFRKALKNLFITTTRSTGAGKETKVNKKKSSEVVNHEKNVRFVNPFSVKCQPKQGPSDSIVFTNKMATSSVKASDL